VSKVGPEVTLKTPWQTAQDRDGSVVRPHHRRLQDPLALQFVQRLEEFGRELHPIAERAARDVDAGASNNVLQARAPPRSGGRGQMVAELADDHLGDQPWPGGSFSQSISRFWRWRR
jgi:hypothetical protein